MPDVEEAIIPGETEEQKSQPVGVLGTVLLIIVVVVIILLLWRSCSPGGTGGESSTAGGIIPEIEQLATVDGGIAVWVKPGADINDILARNNLGDAPVADMGQGTYVVSVGDRDAVATVKALKNDPGLHDAGFVYAEGDTP